MIRKNTIKAAKQYYRSWGRLVFIRRVLHILAEKNLENIGLNPQQFGILVTAIENHNTSPADIARAFIRDHHTMWVQLQEIYIKGYVTLEPNPKWKNRLIIKATDKGEEVYKKVLASKFFTSMFKCLTNEEFEQLNILIDKLCEFNIRRLFGKKPIKFHKNIQL